MVSFGEANRKLTVEVSHLWKGDNEMRNAGKVVLTIVIIAALLFGCAKLIQLSNNVGPTVADTHEEYSGIVPHMEKVSHNTEDACWFYYIDHTTNSIYLVKETTYQFGISPVLNSDGTPMTLEDLDNHR